MVQEAKTTTREAKRLATRERLFDAAVKEFKRDGVGSADVGVIVSEAGVAHGTFFFHFPTKEHVLAELGHREEMSLAAKLDRFLASAHSLEETLEETLRLTATLERRLGTKLFDDLLSLYFSPTSTELSLWPDHPLIARVVQEFELARQRGEIADDPGIDPASAATFFFMGLFALLVTFPRSAARAEMVDQCVALVLRGLEPR